MANGNDKTISELKDKIKKLENENKILKENHSTKEIQQLKDKVELLESIFGKKELPPGLKAKEGEYSGYKERIAGPDEDKLKEVKDDPKSITEVYGNIPEDKNKYIDGLKYIDGSKGWSSFIDETRKAKWSKDLIKR